MPRRVVRIPRFGRYISPVGEDFASVEALGGLAVVAAAVTALLWANLAPGSYEQVWGQGLTLGVGDIAIHLDLRHWLNDGLMAVFFFVVGLEIKREMVVGDLRDPRTAALPALGALGGMVVPAVIFASLNVDAGTGKGWAIPMATDVALAVGVLAILGSLVHPKAKLFLLTLAIVDDLGAIVVIAVFYGHSLDPTWVVGAVAVVVLIALMRRAGVIRTWAYVVPAVVLWICMYESGVHATIAGVALALLTPARPRHGRSVLETLEHRLHPISSFVIVPLFALANAGIVLTRAGVDAALSGSIGLGIVAGLVIGKTVGIFSATFIGVRCKLGRLPEGVSLASIAPVAMVAGIGFTVSLFIADLAFTGGRLEEAKIGVLVASLLAGPLGMIWIALRAARAKRVPRSAR